MTDDGRCPACGRPVDEGAPPAERTTVASTASAGDDLADESAPWHFKLLVVALVVYLGWRFVEIFV